MAETHDGPCRPKYDSHDHVKVTCKYCYKHDLRWQQISGNWRTFEPNGQMHRCLQEALAKDAEDARKPRFMTMPQALAEVRSRKQTNHHEEKETMENFAALHYFTKNFVAIEVTFVEGGKSYFYKANADLGILEGDHVIVLVTDREPTEQLKIVPVKKVYQNPIDALSPSHRYKWIVDKVDFTKHAHRVAMEDNFIAGMRQLEARKQAQAMVDTFKAQYGEEAAKLLEQL